MVKSVPFTLALNLATKAWPLQVEKQPNSTTTILLPPPSQERDCSINLV